MSPVFHYRPVHDRLLLYMGIRWNSSKMKSFILYRFLCKIYCWLVFLGNFCGLQFFSLCSFKFPVYTRFHLYFATLKNDKLAVHLFMYVFVHFGCLQSGVKSTVILIRVFYTVFESRQRKKVSPSICNWKSF